MFEKKYFFAGIIYVIPMEIIVAVALVVAVLVLAWYFYTMNMQLAEEKRRVDAEESQLAEHQKQFLSSMQEEQARQAERNADAAAAAIWYTPSYSYWSAPGWAPRWGWRGRGYYGHGWGWGRRPWGWGGWRRRF